MKRISLTLFLLFALVATVAGCDKFERASFNTLSTSKAVLDTAQHDYEPVAKGGTGKLPHNACVFDLINDGKAAQLAGKDALQTYHGVSTSKGDTTAAAAAVTAQLITLTADVVKIKALYSTPNCTK